MDELDLTPEEQEIMEAEDRKRIKRANEASEVKTLADLDGTIEYYRTGVPAYDFNFGGLPKGCYMQVAGAEGAGKTTIISQLAIGALKWLPENECVGFADFEHRLSPQMLKYHAKINGVDPRRIKVFKPKSGQAGLDVVREWIESDDIRIFVVDSLKAIIDQNEMAKDMDGKKKRNAMAQARLLSEFFEATLYQISTCNKTGILIDHLKKKPVMGMGISKWETSSGVAVKFFASCRMSIIPTKTLKKTTKGVEKKIGREVILKTLKTTVCPMVEVRDITFYYRRGVSVYSDLLKRAKELKIIKYKKPNYLLGKNEKVIAKSKPALKKWILGEGKKQWEKVVELIYGHEEAQFMKEVNGDPEIFDTEFK